MSNKTRSNNQGAARIRPTYTPNPFQDIHQELLPYMWTIAINLGIFLALYKYRKYTIFGHFLIGLGVAATTLITSMPLLLAKPIPTKPSIQTTHVLIGIAIIAAIFLEVLIGCLSKLLNLCKAPSLLIYRLCKFHIYLGYALTILCKFQNYYIMKKTNLYWILLGQDILFFVLLVTRKLFFPTLQKKIEPIHQKNQDIRNITSLQQLYNAGNQKEDAKTTDTDYCSFGNYVYDMKPMLLNHPAGYQILNAVKNRQIDRFIYGMFAAQKLPQLPIHSHSFKSLDLLGKPVGKINIAIPYNNLKDIFFDVAIEQINIVSKTGQIYQIFLKPTQEITYLGYSNVKQLGRFYSLTLNHKITRLYTAVNFIQPSNLRMLKAIGLINQIVLEKLTIQKKIQTQIQLQTERFSNEGFQNKDTIPLLMKVYQNGTLPNLLISGKAENIQLSQPKGFGLCLADLQAGTILIVAGGTGLYPFSDIIDLIFKDYYIKTGANLSQQVKQTNPVLQSQPFDKFKFKLLLAVNQIEDIHPVTLRQLTALNYSNNFSTKLRLKQKQTNGKQLNLQLVSDNFQKLLDNELTNIPTLSKVWLCGPPKMCQSLSQYFQQKYPNEDKILLI